MPASVEDALADGMGFDGSCIEGFCCTQESDMLAFPDASTFQVLPWRPEANAVALTFRLTQDEVAALEAASRES